MTRTPEDSSPRRPEHPQNKSQAPGKEGPKGQKERFTSGGAAEGFGPWQGSQKHQKRLNKGPQSKRKAEKTRIEAQKAKMKARRPKLNPKAHSRGTKQNAGSEGQNEGTKGQNEGPEGQNEGPKGHRRGTNL